MSESSKKFIYFLAMACVAAVVIYYEASMNMQNLTTYLFSYRYGFIPRGFVGTIIDGLLSLFGLELTYFKCLCISGVATAGYYILLFILYALFLGKVMEKAQSALKALMVFFSWFAFTEFISWNNFGRTDEYLTILVIMALILLVMEQAEWLIVPICAVAVMVHSGFTFTNSGLILALLLYKAICAFQMEKRGEKPTRTFRYYMIILILSFAVISALFLYFQVFRQAVSMDVYDHIKEEAIRVASEGDQGGYLVQLQSLIDSELLRMDVYDFESQWRAVNVREFPIFVVLFMPYIIILIRFAIRVFKKANDRLDIFKYIVPFIGVATILPDLLLKVDYGRWVFCIILYYCLMVMTAAALDDEPVLEAMTETYEWLKAHKICWLLLVYPVLFVPFRDVSISDLTLKLMNLIFGYYV